MTALAILLLFFLLDSNEAKGSELFMEQGIDLLLDVNGSVELTDEHDLFWKYNNVKMAKFSSNSKPVIYNPYKERAEVFPNNFSLVLKNVQHSDSGIYKAVLSSSTDHTKVEYNVKVQDPVSPVNLTVIASNSTSFLCERTVICRTVDSTIIKTFVCNKETCSQVDEEHATTISSSLDVYIQEKHIICNHSNQVSWKQERIPISSVCWAAPGTTQTSNGVPTIAVSAAAVAGAILVCIICLAVKCKRQNNLSTKCEGAQKKRQDNSLCSTHLAVNFQEVKSPKTDITHQTEAVYAMVNKVNKSRELPENN
uniref:Immunoglobulin subtype domain-containing protein n=2 Tax=Oryzias latipes TaxID=8090 RepID=A0A3P9KBI9_ORYLA